MFRATTRLWPRLGLSFDDVYRHHTPRTTRELVRQVIETFEEGV